MNTTENVNNLTIKDRVDLERLLEQTYRRNFYHEKHLADKMLVHQFNGEIGDLIKFDGKFFDPAQGNPEKSWVEIDYRNQNQKLARITTEHGFITPGSMPFWTDREGLVWIRDWWMSNNIKPIADTTKIKVFSPRYNEKDGISETFYNEDKLRQLVVYHAPEENAKNLLKNFFQALDYSEDHVEVKNKLKDLELSSNIKIKNFDVLADIVTNQIYHTEQVDHFNGLFSNVDPFEALAVGDPVDLPHVAEDVEGKYHCNLRKSEWAYHTKLTKVAEEFFQRGMKSKQNDREM